MPKGALRTVRIPPGGFTPALGSLTWELAVPSGLHPSQGSALWQAGHVSALVPLGARDLLVGSHSGGVWHLQPDPSDATRWDALPLSDDWDNPDISALVVESGDHVYAGCFARPQTAVRLYEALPGTGATVWQPVGTTLPTGADFGTVYALAVAKGQLVLRDQRLWFTERPPESTPGCSCRYSWTQAAWSAGQNPGGLSRGAGLSPAWSIRWSPPAWPGRHHLDRAVPDHPATASGQADPADLPGHVAGIHSRGGRDGTVVAGQVRGRSAADVRGHQSHPHRHQRQSRRHRRGGLDLRRQRPHLGIGGRHGHDPQRRRDQPGAPGRVRGGRL